MSQIPRDWTVNMSMMGLGAAFIVVPVMKLIEHMNARKRELSKNPLPRNPAGRRMLAALTDKASESSLREKQDGFQAGEYGRAAAHSSADRLRREDTQETAKQTPKPLRLCEKKAHQAYLYALAKSPSCKTRQTLYNWLKAKLSSEVFEYELPDFKTWDKYVRTALRYYRAHPDKLQSTGHRSIQKASELEKGLDSE